MSQEPDESPLRETRKCDCAHGKSIAAIFLVFLLVGVACWAFHPRPSDITPKPGTPCIVQFRRDMLGGASNLPVSPTTRNINGEDVAIQGELIAVNRDAILLKRYDEKFIINDKPRVSQVWIPRSNILLIETDDFKTE